jgi:putative ABC transport system permease protein
MYLLELVTSHLPLLLKIAPVVAAVLFLVVPLLLGKVPLVYNLRNLLVRWQTNFLTALAFTAVVGLLTVMLAFVNGMYRLTEGSAQPGNVIVLSDGATDEQFSNLGYSDPGDVDQTRELQTDPSSGVRQRTGPFLVQTDPATGKHLLSREVYLIVLQPIPNAPKGGRQRRFMQLRGVEDPTVSGPVHGLALHEGGAWFGDAGVQGNDHNKEGALPLIQAVLGEGLARELGQDQGKPTLTAGDRFELAEREWIVTGVMQSAGTTFDSEVWAKRQIVGPKFGKDNYTTFVARTADKNRAKELAEYLTKEYKKASVQATQETEYFDKLNSTNLQFLVAIIIVALFMALGGAFGVMNTMFAAISQRTKDIGVLRILGYARWQVLVSFFLEAMVLALVGGLLGCALGYLANGWTASSIVSSGQGGGKSVVLKLVVDANILAAGMLFTLCMGAIGGLLPSLTAMRLRPLESLR